LTRLFAVSFGSESRKLSIDLPVFSNPLVYTMLWMCFSVFSQAQGLCAGRAARQRKQRKPCPLWRQRKIGGFGYSSLRFMSVYPIQYICHSFFRQGFIHIRCQTFTAAVLRQYILYINARYSYRSLSLQVRRFRHLYKSGSNDDTKGLACCCK